VGASHPHPGDNSFVVLVAALVNRMKCYLNAEEFQLMVRALTKHFDDTSPTKQFDLSALPKEPVPPSDQEQK
jgi:hypothetical protein